MTIAGTINKLNPESLNAFTKGIEGLTLSQAQAALSTKALTDKQKEQILISAGLITSMDSVTASEIKQTVAENILTTEKQQEVLATFELEISEGKLTWERLEAIAAEDTEAGAIAKVIVAKKKENAENLKNIATGKSLLTVLKQQLATLATNPLTWVAVALVGVTTVVLKTADAIEKVREKASELSGEFDSTKTSVKGYKTQIEELRQTINDSGSSVEDVTNARKTLMSVQNELIEKFGDEKETIDLATQAINGQSSALDTLTQKKWQETKNKFNESDIWNDYANWQEGYSDNIDRMVNEMENAWGNIRLSTSDYYGGEYDDIIKMLENQGWTYSASSEVFVKGGSVEDLYEEIVEIQTIVSEDVPDNFLKSLTKDANELKNTLDNYEGMWDSYILNDKIFADDDLANSWKEVNDAYAKYQDLVASGDADALVNSGFAASLKAVLDDENVDESVKDYFEDMYPALTREFEKWEFKTTILPEIKTEGLQGKTQDDIRQMLLQEGTQDGEDIFNSILEGAKEAKIVTGDYNEQVEQLLNLLVEWGILQGIIADTAPKTDESLLSLENIQH